MSLLNVAGVIKKAQQKSGRTQHIMPVTQDSREEHSEN